MAWRILLDLRAKPRSGIFSISGVMSCFAQISQQGNPMTNISGRVVCRRAHNGKGLHKSIPLVLEGKENGLESDFWLYGSMRS